MIVRGAVLEEMGRPRPYTQSRPLAVHALELDQPGPGEILIRVWAAGLCHSDLPVIDGSRPRVMPMVLGHEAAGEVVELGPGVEGLAVGDHVVLAFVPSCGRCGPCVSGRAALCEAGAAANTAGCLLSGERRWRDEDGRTVHHHLGVSAFAEYAVVSARSAVSVDPELPFEIAAVFGLGGVGLVAVLGALLAGATTVIAVDVVPAKLELARVLGATHALAGGAAVVEEIRELTGGGAVRVVETAGSAAVLAQAYAGPPAAERR